MVGQLRLNWWVHISHYCRLPVEDDPLSPRWTESPSDRHISWGQPRQLVALGSITGIATCRWGSFWSPWNDRTHFDQDGYRAFTLLAFGELNWYIFGSLAFGHSMIQTQLVLFWDYNSGIWIGECHLICLGVFGILAWLPHSFVILHDFMNIAHKVDFSS